MDEQQPPRRDVSRHRVGKRKIVEVERQWHDVHIEAGYHEQEWGEPSKPGHELHGEYASPGGPILVGHVEDAPLGPGGPEFKISLPNGASVTVLCADTVRAYLGLHEVDGFDSPEIG